jgi:dynein light chain 1, axonemal
MRVRWTYIRHLSISSNQIDKISNLQGLSCLKILSLGRNSIKKIEGLDAVAETLEELWLSYNMIEKLNGVEMCKKLKNLYLSNNKIKTWDAIASIVVKVNLELVAISRRFSGFRQSFGRKGDK